MDDTRPVTDMGVVELLAWVQMHARRAEDLHERLVDGEDVRDDLLNAIADISGVCVLAAPVALRDAADLSRAARGEITPEAITVGDLLAEDSAWLSSAEDRRGAIWRPFTTEGEL